MSEHTTFSPSRLQAARLVRKMTRPELAKAIGYSASYVGNLESGARDGASTVTVIAHALHYPEEYFFRGELPVPTRTSLAYRRKSSMKALDQDWARAFGATIAADVLPLVSSFARVRHEPIPDMSRSDGAEAAVIGETAADMVRGRFGMGNAPLRHALDLVESMGIPVFWMDGPAEMDGASFWIDDRPIIVLNGSMRDGYRVRFTVLHELFHILSHRAIAAPGKTEDREADAFASAMLMPRATFHRTMRRRFDAYGLLDDRSVWGASVGAMVRRAKDLSIFSEYDYRDACMKLQKLGWRSGEPRPASPEESSTHRHFLSEAGERGLSSMDLAEQACTPYTEFIAAVPLAVEYERKLKLSDLFA